MKRFLAVAVLLVAGCSAMHPGAVNQFDNASYNTLLTTDSVIQQAKADYVAGKFPTSAMPAMKTAINNLVAVYNVADSAYLEYHTAVAQGTATPAQVTAVTNALKQVNSATTALTNAKGAQ